MEKVLDSAPFFLMVPHNSLQKVYILPLKCGIIGIDKDLISSSACIFEYAHNSVYILLHSLKCDIMTIKHIMQLLVYNMSRTENGEYLLILSK